MLEGITIGVFCALLLACVATGLPLVAALAVGVVLFCGYGLLRGCELRAMLVQALGSMRSAAMILTTFVLIGMLTALWRASGTIALIVAEASALVGPATVVPLTFLLCSGMSVLVGSSFATAATMGSICVSLGMSMGASPVWLGGAMVAGIYVGDRCSPVSTSALLVAQLTHTELASNVGRMLRSGAVPFVASCVVYAVAGALTAGSASGESLDVQALFSAAFDLHWVAVVPAVLVLALALAHLDVRVVMGVGIVTAAVLCVALQGMGVGEVARSLVFGYEAADTQVAALLNGGGILSMVNVGAIVCISSAYAGIFAETHMLDGVRGAVTHMGKAAGAYAATLVVGVVTCVISCNQTLSTMLTHQLCGDLRAGELGVGAACERAGAVAAGHASAECAETLRGDTAGAAVSSAPTNAREATMLDLEDSVIVVAALVPWSIAGAVPLATVGAPIESLLAACFLYLLPLWRLVRR